MIPKITKKELIKVKKVLKNSYEAVQINDDDILPCNIKPYKEKDILGEGGSRIVLRINDNYALKIAKNRLGITQNETELSTYTHKKYRKLREHLAKIYNTITYKKVLVALICERCETKKMIEDDLLTEDKALKKLKLLAKKVLNNNPKNAKEIYFGDLDSITSYGLVNNHVKILDYGYNNDGVRYHYNDIIPKNSSLRLLI